MAIAPANSGTGLGDKHPEYMDMFDDWTLMRDAYKGQRQVKRKTLLYLPATSGMYQDGMTTAQQSGYKQYLAYMTRARFPNFVREGVQAAIGMLNAHPHEIKLPKELETITTTKSEDMSQLLRRIHESQLITGRIGLFLDLPQKGSIDDLPYIATYDAENMINWDVGSDREITKETLNLMVLDESGYERSQNGDGLSWTTEDRFRVLALGPVQTNEREEQGYVYRFGVFKEDESYDESKLVAASYRGKTLEEIPFVMVNSCDLAFDVDEPALLDLGNLCMTIYRGEADYRQNLFMQGQDTFVTIGGTFDDTDDVRTGAGARLDLPIGGDAKYVGVTSDGLSEQRQSLVEDRQRAGSMGAQSLDSTSRERESGASMNIRIAARTADLNQVALAAAQGLENILKMAATWIDADPEEVKVMPNMEFGDNPLSGQSMVEKATARNLGYPISAKSLHENARKKGLTNLTFEEEMAEAKKEEKTPFAKAITGGNNPEPNGDGSPGKDNRGDGPPDDKE